MNCKKGDLAIQVRSCAGNHGMVVRVLEYVGVDPMHEGQKYHWGYGACWLCLYLGSEPSYVKDDVLYTEGGGLTVPLPDSWLRPLPKLTEQDEVTQHQTEDA